MDKNSPSPPNLGAGEDREEARRAFDKFRIKVTQMPELFAQLQGAVDSERFIKNIVELGSAQGFLFSPAEVDSALREARRRWVERNVV